MPPLRWSRPPVEHDEGEDAGLELLELPAAVVCARCGRADCSGLCGDRAEQSESGVVLVVPWERPDQALWTRFWATTRLEVEGPDVFFASLPDGPLSPAFSYAVLAEVVAAGACVAVFAALALGMLGVLLPVFTRALLAEADGRATLVRMVSMAWLSFTALLVGVHALHGWALHRLARTPQTRTPLRRALRFGLYTAGLDVVASPVGLVWMVHTLGARSLDRLSDLLFRASNRATAAMLRGFYQLDAARAERLRRRGTWLSVGAVLLGLVACLAAVVAVV